MNMQDFIYLDDKTDRTVDLIDSYGKKDAKAKIKCLVDDNAVNTYYGTTVITSSTNYNSNKTFNDNTKIKEIPLGTYEYGFNGGCLVVYRDEIHGIGGSSGSKRKHYKWNGTDWVYVSTLPSELGSYTYAVVYNDEIHIFDSTRGHLKWNGTSWATASSLPYSGGIAGAVVYNNEIHIFGGYDNSYQTKHYKWNGESWTSVSTLPCSADSVGNPGFTVYNNEIHFLGGNMHETRHYKFSKTSTGYAWTSVSTLPYSFQGGCAVSSIDGIHILGGGSSSSASEAHYNYRWNGTSWNYVSYITYPFYSGVHNGAVDFNDSIFIMEDNHSSYTYYVYLYMMRNFSMKIIDLVTKKGFYKFELSLK